MLSSARMNVTELARAARAAAGPLSRSSVGTRNAALAAMASALRDRSEERR